jgi:ketosteroid isomerase-like protein
MRRAFIITLLVIAAAPLAVGQKTERRASNNNRAVREVRQVERELNEAFVRGDVTTLDRNLADDYMSTSPLGVVRTKVQVLEALRTGERRYESLDFDDVRVRVYGNAVVLTSHRTERGQYRGQDTGGQFRQTRVYVRLRGRWRLVATQSTRIAQP